MKENTNFKPPLPCGYTHSWERLRVKTLRKVGVHKAVCCCMQHHCGNSCDVIRCVGLASPLDYADAVERVSLLNAPSLPHYKLLNAQVMTSLYPVIASPVATGKRRSSRCGCTGSCSREHAHRRLRLYGRSSIWIEAGMEFGVTDQPSLTAHLHGMRKGLERVL